MDRDTRDLYVGSLCSRPSGAGTVGDELPGGLARTGRPRVADIRFPAPGTLDGAGPTNPDRTRARAPNVITGR